VVNVCIYILMCVYRLIQIVYISQFIKINLIIVLHKSNCVWFFQDADFKMIWFWWRKRPKWKIIEGVDNKEEEMVAWKGHLVQEQKRMESERREGFFSGLLILSEFSVIGDFSVSNFCWNV